jgi:glycosyltransferase involved in cell wall biosynthesis
MSHLVSEQPARGKCLRVIMIVTGFPHPDDLHSGVFNLRAAKALSHSVDITVIHLRAWKPGRPRVESSNVEGMPVVTVTVPQAPVWRNFNLTIYRVLGWSRVRSSLAACDLIHSVDLGFPAILGSAWGRLAQVRHVTQVITDIPFSGYRCRSIVGWKKHVHGVACNSRLLTKQLLELFPDAPNVRTVYRGVDLNLYRPDGTIAGPLANRSPVRFLYLGGFPSYSGLPHNSNTKGGETLLEAWRAAEETLIASGASLCVAGPDCDSSEFADWRASLKRPDRVHLGGLIHPDIVPAYIRSSDVTLIPSLQEGLPNLAMEAGACGRTVFGSDVGGIPEVVTSGETGLILPAGIVTAWKDALIAYATKVDELKIMGTRARHRMEALFDSKEYATKMLDLYAAALREPLDAKSI